MDFVDYLKTGTQFYALTTAAYKMPEDLCGKKVGSIRSTHYPIDIAAWSDEHCVKAGQPAIEFVAGENSPDVRTQLKQGRIDGAAQGAETIPYLSEQDGGVFKLLGTPFTTAYSGIAFSKDDTAFRDLIADTLQGMIADGSHGQRSSRSGISPRSPFRRSRSMASRGPEAREFQARAKPT